MYKDLGLIEKRVDAGLTLSGKPNGNMVRAFEPNSYAPVMDKDYILSASPNYIDIISWIIDDTWQPLLISGPHGSGKSSNILAAAAIFNIPVISVAANANMDVEDLFGHLSINKRGEMVFVPGPLTIAAENGAIFLLEEADAVNGGLLGLHQALDGHGFTVNNDEGKWITPKLPFKMAFTCNGGTVENTQNYANTNVFNQAFMDRMIHLRSEYMTPDVELNLLKKKFPKMPEATLKAAVTLAGEVRRLYMGQFNEKDSPQIQTSNIELTMSTRALIRFCNLLQKYQPLKRTGINILSRSLENSLTNSASRSTAALIYGLADRIFKPETI